MSAPAQQPVVALRSAAGPATPDLDFDLDLGRPRLDDGDWRRFEGYVREIFTAFGMPPDTPGTRDTPRRFLRALQEATSGYDGDPKLVTTFPAEPGASGPPGQVVEGPITFHALCEHHALPFFGVVRLGYVPAAHIIGLSKLTRLVRLYARRFTVQERLGAQIADTLDDMVAPHGVAVRIEAQHLCVHMRGVAEHDARTVTTVWRGCYEEVPALRQEFLG